MIRTTLILFCTFLLAGCQTPPASKMTVIAPAGEDASKPAIQWVKKNNIYHLTLNPSK